VIGGLLSVLSMLFTFDHTVCDETQIKEVQECGREVINFERQDEMQGRNLRVLLLPTIVQKYRYRALIARLSERSSTMFIFWLRYILVERMAPLGYNADQAVWTSHSTPL